jgi:MoxR-like ATPase
MMQTMTIPVGATLQRLIRVCHASRRGACLMGPTGAGKTALLRAMASELGIGYNRVDLAVADPVDIGGMPTIVGGKMCFMPPPWLPPADQMEGILVLEELTRLPPPVRNAALNLISERSVNGYTLPPGWSIFATANPADDEHIDAEEVDVALLALLPGIGDP